MKIWTGLRMVFDLPVKFAALTVLELPRGIRILLQGQVSAAYLKSLIS